MSSEWKNVLLGEVASTRNGAGIKQDFFAEKGVPLARVSNFSSGTIDLSDCIFVDDEHAQRWQTHRISHGDVIVATVGSWPPNWSSVVGKVVRAPEGAVGALQNQNTCCVIALSGVTDQRFLYFLLSSEDFVQFAANSAAGSANQARLGIANLLKFPFSLPPLREQQAISNLLASLDNRISLLRETNTTLEAIAQALFKSWFVDFDPVRAKQQGIAPQGMDAATAALFPDSFEESELGEVPKGWRVGTVADIGEVICGKTPPTSDPANYGDDVPFITIPDMHNLLAVTSTNRSLSSLGAATQKKKTLPSGSICVSCIATAGLVIRVTTPSQTNQQINSVVPFVQWGQSFPLFTLRRIGDAVRAGGSGGSVFHNLSKSGFEQLKVLFPSEQLAIAFGEIVEQIIEKIIANQKQAQTLTTLRDTLLPRLISGQLRLPE